SVGKSATEPVAIACRHGRKFGEKKWGQLENRKTSGKRLRNVHHQPGRHRTEEEEPTGTGAIPIDRAAQPREYLRCVLCFVEDDEAFRLGNPVKLYIEPNPIRLPFQIEVLSSETPGEGRLPALAWS